jgi:bifunctional pyridoxal-dependent enzyme with beta-cystathionase and maltose regulon repressor activities
LLTVCILFHLTQDFKACPAVQQALLAHIQDGTYGYTMPTGEAVAAVTDYLTAQGVTVEHKDEILFFPGAVQTLNLACKLIPPGAGVMVRILSNLLIMFPHQCTSDCCAVPMYAIAESIV